MAFCTVPMMPRVKTKIIKNQKSFSGLEEDQAIINVCLLQFGRPFEKKQRSTLEICNPKPKRQIGIKQEPCHYFGETMNYLGETFAEMLI